MRIAKPLLLTTTPIGVGWGLDEGWRLTGGLVFLMLALLSLIGVAMASVVLTIRRERAREAAAAMASERADPEGRSGGPPQRD